MANKQPRGGRKHDVRGWGGPLYMDIIVLEDGEGRKEKLCTTAILWVIEIENVWKEALESVQCF